MLSSQIGSKYDTLCRRGDIFRWTHHLRFLVLGHEDKVGEVAAAADIAVAPVVELVVVDGLEEHLRLLPLQISVVGNIQCLLKNNDSICKEYKH